MVHPWKQVIDSTVATAELVASNYEVSLQHDAPAISESRASRCSTKVTDGYPRYASTNTDHFGGCTAFADRVLSTFHIAESSVELFVYADPWAIMFHTTGKLLGDNDAWSLYLPFVLQCRSILHESSICSKGKGWGSYLRLVRPAHSILFSWKICREELHMTSSKRLWHMTEARNPIPWAEEIRLPTPCFDDEKPGRTWRLG